MKAYTRINPTIVQHIGWRTLVTKTFIMPDGEYTFVTHDVEGSKNVATIALTKDRQVIIGKQYRVGPERMMTDLPGGGVNSGEDPIDAAQRELLEETGYQAGFIRPIGSVFKDAYTNSRSYFFLATDCELTGQGQNLDEGEFIEVMLISIKELFHRARTSQMVDTEAVFLAQDELTH